MAQIAAAAFETFAAARAAGAAPPPRMSSFDATMIVEGCWELTRYEPSEEAYIEACQHLIDTGMAWSLQGFFGRTCQRMIDEGYCTPAN